MKYFSIAMLIVGTIIGAGFASGRELISFFGTGASPFIAILCGALIFLISAMFMFIGSKTQSKNISEVNKHLFGRCHAVLDIVLLFNSFVVLSGMLAGMDSVGKIIFPLKPLYSVLSGILCIIVVNKGIKGLLDCNKIVVPVIIIVMIFFFFYSGRAERTFDGFKIKNIGTAIIYICMNMMLASTVLTTMGKLNKKTIFISSGLAAVIMTMLIFGLIISLNNTSYSDSDMPVLEIAKRISPVLFGLIIAIIIISIFTTMLTALAGLTSWFENIFGNKLFSAIIVFLAALALSNVGFSNVVDYLYPLIGAVGLFYTLLGIIFTFKVTVLPKPRNAFLKRRNTHIHNGGEHA